MSKLEIVVNVLVLVVTLAACGAVGVEPAAAAGAVTEVESAMEPRARDAGFLRHNYGAKPWVAKAEATFERRARDAGFIRHNYGTEPGAAKAVVDTTSVARFEPRARDADFLRHNYGTKPWAAKVNVGKPLHGQGDW